MQKLYFLETTKNDNNKANHLCLEQEDGSMMGKRNHSSESDGRN